jgi:hypothetical protein
MLDRSSGANFRAGLSVPMDKMTVVVLCFICDVLSVGLN